MRLGRVVARVGILSEDRKVEPGIKGAQPDAPLLGVPGQQVHGVTEQDRLPLGGLHPQGQQLRLSPLPKALLDLRCRDRFWHRILFARVLGTRRHDLLVLSEQVREGGVHEHGRITELTSLTTGFVAGEDGQLTCLVGVVCSKDLVGRQAAGRFGWQPARPSRRRRGPVGKPVLAVVIIGL
ncbi:hypothetical protein ABZZ20_01755 [Streptomyces sp. NPDC006430]|uniref:hypothetical protein n=1 Tax=Streptomyces sp. NPDC006430 TaxID=3154299 RepID=UPI00339DBFD0